MNPPIPLGILNVEETKISPNVLLIIVILAAIFFISGLLHLLVRLLFRASNIDSEDTGNVTAFQGQLQQLFHLHDAGVDQSFIDTLPVFLYKAIIGAKNTLDCAVCLCEFEAEDKLRLLPKCSHAFHMECIDTWLLSHSTCPLCRSNLLPDCPPRSSCAPIVLVLESGSESSREIAFDRDTVGSTMSSVRSSITRLSFHGEEEFGSSCKNETQVFAGLSEANVVPVKLGKFKSVDDCREGGEGSSSTSNVDGRRCFSMGSYEYVLDDSSILQVAIKPASRKANGKKLTLPLIPGHRPAMSECDCHSSRDVFKGFEAEKSVEFHVDVGSSLGNSASAASVGGNKRESFSISKIWLRSKDKASTADSSNRTLSFRFPLQQTATGESKPKCSMERTLSEINYTGSESGLDVELGRTMSLESCPTSFTRRTLLRLAGKQNKVVHSSSTLPV